MNNIEKSTDFLKKFSEIGYDMSKGNLEDVTNILNHYNESSTMVNGVNHYYNITPLEAACLNARSRELTGQDHEVFLAQQMVVLNKMIMLEDNMNINSLPSIYQRLKNNLTGKGIGISVFPNKKDSYIDKYEQIKFDFSKGGLKDITDILDNYDKDSVLISGVQYHFRPTPLEGASLNARYHELTGKDHKTFLKVQEQILLGQMKNKQGITIDGKPTIYEQLRNKTLEIGNKSHVLTRSNEIIINPQKASLKDISDLLNYFNGRPVLINGIAYYPFNDPNSAIKLNDRYREITGQDHKVFIEQMKQVCQIFQETQQIISKNENTREHLINEIIHFHINNKLKY